ncbi:MAG TPA: 2-oxo acid dehydrogenase subunit E2, partial [Gemmatimonadales bacterium]
MSEFVFGTNNAAFVQVMYEQYLRDPASVSEEWRQLFDNGKTAQLPVIPTSRSELLGEAGREQGEGTIQTTLPPSPSPLPQKGLTPITGPAARLVSNMTESLAVPTATSFREIAVDVLDARRKALNAQLGTRGLKISFTHLIGYAIVQAAKQFPMMVRAFHEVEGKPHRFDPDGIHLGLAVDVERKDGSRGLVVPVLKHAEAMDFTRFHATYESLVEKARTNRLVPDDFAGATITLTNPGTIGTVASVPRLMRGQGSIIATGAIRDLAGARVMTITSTYDHRIIQGAESGLFLRRLEALLQGDDGFYDAVSANLGLTAVSSQPSAVSAPERPAPPGATESVSVEDLKNVAAAMGLVKAHRHFGHMAARLDPLGSAPPGDPALEPSPLGLTPEVMARIPAEVLRIYVPGATLAEAYPNLHATYCGTIAYEVEHIASHEQRVWLRQVVESGLHRRP